MLWHQKNHAQFRNHATCRKFTISNNVLHQTRCRFSTNQISGKKIINKDPITIAGFIEFMTRLDRSSTIQSNQSQAIVETQGDGGAFGLGFG